MNAEAGDATMRKFDSMSHCDTMDDPMHVVPTKLGTHSREHGNAPILDKCNGAPINESTAGGDPSRHFCMCCEGRRAPRSHRRESHQVVVASANVVDVHITRIVIRPNGASDIRWFREATA